MKYDNPFRHLLLLTLLLGSLSAKATFFYFSSASILTPVVNYSPVNIQVTASLADPCVTVDSSDMVIVNNKVLLVLHVSETTCLSGGGCIMVITPYSNTFSICPPAGLHGKYGFGLVINEYCPSVFPMTTDTISTTDSIQVFNTNTVNLSGCDSLTYNGTVYHSSGNYLLPYNSVAGCDSSIHLQVVLSTPDTSVSQSGAVLTSNATGATYQWINCTGKVPIPGATAISYTAIQNGSYAVVVTKNGCTDTSGCNVVIGLGVYDTKDYFPFRLYPNPIQAAEPVFIDGPARNDLLEMLDMSGRRIWMKKVNEPGPVPLSLPSEPGCYLLVVTQQDGSRYVSRILRRQ